MHIRTELIIIFYTTFRLSNATKSSEVELECHSVNGKFKCDVTCKNCAECGNPKSCTSCFPGHYKIALSFYDQIFECSPSCSNISKGIRFKKYSYCSKKISTSTAIPSSTRTLVYHNQHSTNQLYTNKDLVVILIVIIGILMGCLLTLSCKKILLTISKFKKKKKTKEPDVEENLVAAGGVQPSKAGLNSHSANKLMIYNNLEIVNNENYELGEIIGGGSYSRVYEGKFKGNNVAIKVALREGRKSIHKELQIYDKVSHPHILPALGVHLAFENLLFMPLRKFNLADYFIDYGVTIQADKLYQYCIQLSSALKYLHENEILHCDIKIENILVKDDDGEEIELSDFGCAIDLSHDREARHNGTTTHTAYELLKDYVNSEKRSKGTKASDVWAFAVTVWQIYNKSDKIPNDFITPRQILNNYEKGKKLPKPKDMPDRMWRYLILQCFDLQPTGRPSMKEIHEKVTTKDY